VPDPGRCPDVAGLTSGELERIAHELRASLALAQPDSRACGPIVARLSAISAELAGRRDGERGEPGISLCSCGFATDDPGWFDGHLFQYPGHEARPQPWRAGR